MKGKRIFSIIVIAVLLTACNFSKSVKIDVDNKLVTHGDGLSVERVFITTKGQQPSENTFAYGETVYTNFDGLSGFTIQEGDFFPELEVWVISKAGDTVLRENSLLGGLGQPKDVRALNGQLILANPMRSGQDYTAKYRLYDAKGGAQFFSEMDFSIVRDSHIKVEGKGLKAGEVYLKKMAGGGVITDGRIPADESVSMDFQFLEGYQIINDQIAFGMQVTVTDAQGRVVLNNPDVLKNTMYPPLAKHEAVMSTLVLNGDGVSNPFTWSVRLWDKNGDAEIRAEATIYVTEKP